MNKEDILQINCIKFLKYKHPNILVWHTANERKTHPARGRKLKQMGVLAGVSDIIIYKNKQLYAIELKIKPNKPTDRQKDFLKRAEDQGAITKIFYTLDEFMEFCNKYFGGHSAYYWKQNRNK